MYLIRAIFLGGCLWTLILAGICSAQEATTDPEIRLANGVPVEGTFKSAAPEGLTVETARGARILPWKYLSAGTRWRYERPMLEELERQRIKAEKAAKAKAKAEAAAKAAAAKAAAATNKAAKTSATIPAAVATNKPAAK